MTTHNPIDVTFDAASATDIATMLHLVAAQEEGLVSNVHVPGSLQIFTCRGPNFPWEESVRLTDPIGQTMEFLRLGSGFGQRLGKGIDPGDPFAGLAVLAMAVRDGRFRLAPVKDFSRIVDSQLSSAFMSYPDWMRIGSGDHYVDVGPDIGGNSLKDTVGFALSNQVSPVIGDEQGLFRMAQGSTSLKLGQARPARLVDPVIARLTDVPTDLSWEDLYRFAQDREFRKVTKALLTPACHPPAPEDRSDHELFVEGMSLAADLVTGTHAAAITSFVFKCWRAWIVNRKAS